MKVKIFREENINALETKINDFLKAEEFEVIADIQYQIASNALSNTYSVMIAYAEKEEE